MAAVTFAVPGSLDQPTGGYNYDRRVIAGLRQCGCEVDVIDLGDGFPRPAPETVQAALPRLRRVPAGQPIVVDGLALGVLPDVAAALRSSHRLIALVHHPLALESGLAPAEIAALRESERAALAAVRRVVVTSPATSHVLVADYGVPAEIITIALPGTEGKAGAAAMRKRPMQAADQALNLLAVGAVVPRKGYDVLIEALNQLTNLNWQLVIAGDCKRDRATAVRLAAAIARKRLESRVALAGAVNESDLAALYREADVFVLASRFEGYGMAYAEAIAHGLPVVGTRVGAIPDTVPADAGILVPADDAAALAGALRAMITDTGLRRRCSEAARRAPMPTWEAAAQAFLDVLRTAA
ncbi:MAG TPA: glycosyltransferase family 4 protein [Xanthobacteraceae bacterium]|jgi:glycosyltransferase involved in cell wall biosynthesis|nr:glycosyltransferase family 4 protein [Xanthobacteraceae bacterium]